LVSVTYSTVSQLGRVANSMILHRIVFFLFLVSSVFSSVLAAPIQVNSLRTWQAPDHTRLVFDLAAPVAYKLFSLENPYRLVVDIKNSALKESLPEPDKGDAFLKGIRSAVHRDKSLRVVLDLQGKSIFKSFLLKPYKQYGNRLVVDLYKADTNRQKIVKRAIEKKSALRDLVIAIDAGHGGEDPGASGSKGTNEKDVVLGIARNLAAVVDKEPGMRAVLIRDGDYYLSLRQRTSLAT